MRFAFKIAAKIQKITRIQGFQDGPGLIIVSQSYNPIWLIILESWSYL